MGGKKADYRPVQVYEDPEQSEEQSEVEAGGLDLSGLELEVDKPDYSVDAALAMDPMGSEQPDIGTFGTQFPVFEVTPATETEQEEIRKLFPEGHVYRTADIAKCVVQKEKRVHVMELQWDKNQSQGQIRGLNWKLVEHYVARLKSNPPRKMIRILAKATSGMCFCLRRVVATVFSFSQMVISYLWGANTSVLHCYLVSSPLVGRQMTLVSQKSFNMYWQKF